MKIIKALGVSLVSIVVLALVTAIFIKKEYAVDRSIVINKPKQEVFNYIKLLKNQDSFSVWATRDPKMKKSYRGTDGQVGFVSAWDSQEKNVGTGEQEIKKITEGQRIDFELRFLKPFEATEKAFMSVTAVDEKQTKVNWGFNGKMKYPMNLMLLFMDMEEMLGKDFDTGLSNLKRNLEKAVVQTAKKKK